MKKILVVAALMLAACSNVQILPDDQQPKPPTAKPSTPVATKPATPAPKPPAPATPAQPVEFVGAWKNKDWDEALLKEIRANDLQKVPRLSDAAKYCPQFSVLTEAQKETLFATAIVAATSKESSYDPKSFMYECRKKTKDGKACSTSETCYNPYSDARWDTARGWCMKGDASIDDGYIISRGLLQMSPASASSQKYGCGKMREAELFDPIKNLRCATKMLATMVKEDKYLGTTTSVSPMTYRGGARYWAVFRNASDSQAYIRSKTRALPFCK